MQALIFVLDALITLIVIAFLLRALFPLVRADFRNPIGQAVLRVTDPLVLPLRKLLRPAGRVDVAAIVALLIVQITGTALIFGLAGAPMASPLVDRRGRAARPCAHRAAVLFLRRAAARRAELGRARRPQPRRGDPRSGSASPLLRPLRRVIPPLGGLDLSPIFVLIGLQALQILLR